MKVALVQMPRRSRSSVPLLNDRDFVSHRCNKRITGIFESALEIEALKLYEHVRSNQTHS